jgi:hypothetical protein
MVGLKSAQDRSSTALLYDPNSRRSASLVVVPATVSSRCHEAAKNVTQSGVQSAVFRVLAERGSVEPDRVKKLLSVRDNQLAV